MAYSEHLAERVRNAFVSEDEFDYWVGLALEFNKKAKKSKRKKKSNA